MRTIFLLSILAVIVFLQINGEKIPVNEGAIEDGIFYREVGRNFLYDMEEGGYNLVQLTRILPFALLNLSFSAFHIVKDNEGLRNGMIIWQVIYLALAVYWYFRIAKKLRLRNSVLSLGFVLLFANYAWLKSIWYHPFSPDLLAFALGMGQVNYFLRYEKFKLGMLSVIGTFVSPLLLISGLLMLFLPGDKLPEYEGERPKSSFPLLIALLLPLALAVLGWGLWNWGTESLGEQLLHVFSLLAIAFLVVGIAVQNPIDWEKAIPQLKKRTRTDRLSKGIMGFSGILLVLVMLSGDNTGLGVFRLLRESGQGVFRHPGDFLLETCLHWGIAVLFTGLFMHRFLEELGKLGWAVCFTLLLGLLLIPFFKSAALAALVPLWVVILLKALKRYHWNNKDLILTSILAIGISLAWLPLNSAQLREWMASGGGNLKSLEIQKWALHFATLISTPVYLILLLILSLITWFLYYRKKQYARRGVLG
ncbi:hypothetical protein [Algoriphagus sp. CAU 1675]|uniref:hypothetical protein n=1 Tax=Algoriphagus sp. CAU 1675 TaxID=3032597 RepID=UPI0023DA2541|nr:hypothetical protein [Algoriphagus sp. CAU 1675]MDF2159416.1 hypothetical protein [Algoriphagus sp. CAU 1675]